MKTFLKRLLVVVVSQGSIHALAQDINFSQFYEMPMLRNPALTGIFMGDIRVTGAHRSQWGSITTPYRTMAAGVEFKLPFKEDAGLRASLGFQVTHDIAGDSKLSKTQLLPVVNFHILLDDRTNSFLSAAFMFGMTQHRFDNSNLTFDDQFVNGSYNPVNPTRQLLNNSNISYFDMSAGVLFNHGGLDVDDVRYYLGLGIFNFNPRGKNIKFFLGQPDSLKSPDLKLGLNGGITVPSGENRVTLYADYFHQTGNSLFQLGGLFSHDFEQLDLDEDLRISITGGLMYRWADAIVPVVKFEYYQLSMGISYDVNVSKLVVASSSRGGLEVTVGYKSFLRLRNSTLRQISCPRF
jgi:type IX secretion system PorP/SprF family membrane protein